VIGTPTQNRATVGWEGEEGDVRVLTYGHLSALVNPEAVAEIRRRGEAKNKGESQRKV
jgi:hypothetical protein